MQVAVQERKKNGRAERSVSPKSLSLLDDWLNLNSMIRDLAKIFDKLDTEDQIVTLNALIKATKTQSSSIVLYISPEVARWILDNLNTRNRNKRKAKIRMYSQDQTDEEWMLTGDTIKFDWEGLLIDGQNRLSSIIKSGLTTESHVVFGIDPAAYRVIDHGAGRNGGDTFKTANIEYPGITSRAVRWLWIFNNPKVDRSTSLSDRAILDYYEKMINKAALKSHVQQAMKMINGTIPHGTLAAMLYLMEKKDPKLVKIFTEDLQKGNRGAGTLLKYLYQIKSSPGMRVKETHVTALTILAWNAYRRDAKVTLKLLTWNEETPHPTIE